MAQTDEERRRKACEATKKWRLANPEHRAAYARQWRKDNPENTRAIQRRTYLKNTEAARERSRRYREKHSERLKAADRARPRNPEHGRKWREKNLEYLKARYRTKQLAQFGITEADYAAHFDRQGGVCAICRRPQPGKRRLAVDHDHTTGVVRGLLCTGCNSAVGRLGDTVEGLMRAVAYLVRAQSERAA